MRGATPSTSVMVPAPAARAASTSCIAPASDTGCRSVSAYGSSITSRPAAAARMAPQVVADDRARGGVGVGRGREPEVDVGGRRGCCRSPWCCQPPWCHRALRRSRPPTVSWTPPECCRRSRRRSRPPAAWSAVGGRPPRRHRVRTRRPALAQPRAGSDGGGDVGGRGRRSTPVPGSPVNGTSHAICCGAYCLVAGCHCSVVRVNATWSRAPPSGRRGRPPPRGRPRRRRRRDRGASRGRRG